LQLLCIQQLARWKWCPKHHFLLLLMSLSSMELILLQLLLLLIQLLLLLIQLLLLLVQLQLLLLPQPLPLALCFL
jgi:hypothetical protein